jgi:NitT/TauT family transport system ATP-binding protein
VVPVLDGMSFVLKKGKILGIFGPNGSGKTTLLDIVAGLLVPDKGEINLELDGSDRPGISYAFQAFRDTLMPWEPALHNVAFPLRAAGLPKMEALAKAEQFLDKCEIAFPRGNYPYQLSAGQQQTVSLSRALVINAHILLLDEPFSALDHKARFRMQDLVGELVASEGTGVIFVSHDIDELLYMSDAILLFSRQPARILREFDIYFPRPRDHTLLVSNEFATLRQEILTLFLEEVQVL